MTSGTIDIEERIRLIFDDSDLAWWEMELPSGAVFFHPNKARMFGGKPEEFVHYTAFTERLSQKDYTAANKAMQDHLSGKTSCYKMTYRLTNAQGHERLLFDHGKIVGKDENGTAKIMGIIVDVTDSDLERSSGS